MNYFDSLKAMFQGNYDPNAINEMYGVPQGVVDQAQSGRLMQMGLGMIAAGQQLTPAQRAQVMQQIGSGAGDFQSSIYNAAQSRLMSDRIKEARAQKQQQADGLAQLTDIISSLPDDDPRKAPATVYLRLGDAGKAAEVVAGRGGQDVRTGLTPIPVTKADGTAGYVLPRTDGGYEEVQLPEGAQFYTPEGLAAAKSRGQASGKASGEASALLPAAQSKMERALNLAKSVLDDPNLDNAVGVVQSRLPDVVAETLTPGVAGLRRKLEQMQGTAFIEAYQELKGGGAITEVEGLKAEQAFARLSTSQDEASFRAALRDYMEAIEAGYRKLRERAGQSPVQTQPQQRRRIRYDANGNRIND